MASEYLSGIVTAWCLMQVALGVFFLLGHFLARREPDLAIFAGLCAALSLHSWSSARAQAAVTLSERAHAVDGVVAAAFLAGAANLHFALSFTGARRPRWLVPGLYAAAFAFELVNAFGQWWREGSAHVIASSVFGRELLLWSATPTPVATLGFAWIACELVAAQALLFWSYRRGRREAAIAFVGGLVLLAVSCNDMLFSAGVVTHTLFLVSHGFMLYAFTVASTLVLRYRRTVGALVRTERDLRRATRQLAVSHAELREIQDELLTKQELAAVGELAASIAHEVRNPLAIISNALAGLRRERATPADRGVLLGIVEEETERLSRLVTDLLRFARPSSLQHRVVDLTELFELIRATLREPFELSMSRDSLTSARIDADPTLLRVVMENLVQNACQAMPSGGPIEVRITQSVRDGVDGVFVEIRDEGPGMDAATLDRALDPFFTTKPSGTGLGLPIVQRIVRAHAGHLELRSTPGEGTRALLWLPSAATHQLSVPDVARLRVAPSERPRLH